MGGACTTQKPHTQHQISNRNGQQNNNQQQNRPQQQHQQNGHQYQNGQQQINRQQTMQQRQGPTMAMQMPVSRVAVMYNKTMVRQETVKLVDNQYIQFTYDALIPSKFTVFLFVEETVAFYRETVEIINPSQQYNRNKKVDQFLQQNPIKGAQYQSQIPVDLNEIPDDGLKHKKIKDLQTYWPVIIKIDQENQMSFYYFEFKKHGNNFEMKYAQQRMQLLENNQTNAYLVQEIYGINNTELIKGQEISKEDQKQLANQENTNQECIICFTDVIDTIILPCRHMCICMECAKSIQKQTQKNKKKCPICRKDIESFLKISKQPKKQ